MRSPVPYRRLLFRNWRYLIGPSGLRRLVGRSWTVVNQVGRVAILINTKRERVPMIGGFGMMRLEPSSQARIRRLIDRGST